jgi:hypothetical protein
LGFWSAFAVDRPILPWLYMLTTPLAGADPARWHILGILAHTLAALGLWWALRSLWPEHPAQATWVALSFAVYPGFLQSPISIIYTHFFLLFALFAVSLVGMILSVRLPRWRLWLTLGSLVAAGLNMFSLEYFSGLEWIRPVVLWIVLAQQTPQRSARLRRVLVTWLPYLALTLAYLGWRTLLFRFPTYQPGLLSDFSLTPVAAIGGLAGAVGRDLLLASAGAWSSVFMPPDVATVGVRTMAASYVLALAGGAAVAGYLGWAAPRQDELPATGGAGRRSWSLQAIALGFLALIAGGLPVWVTQLPLGLQYPWDRLTLPFMLGTSLVLVGLTNLIPWRAPRVLALGVLVGLAIGFHFRNEVSYARDWEDVKPFFWQLTWRVPGLKSDTAVLTNEIPFDYYSDNSLTAPLNWTYAPDQSSTQMGYMLYYLPLRLGKGLKGTSPGLPIVQEYRATRFVGSTSQVLALLYWPPACVHVLDVVLDDSMPTIPPTLSQFVPLSRLDLIEASPAEPAAPPEAIFGPEPPHDSWCYYFEKADLARQQGDWAEVVRLGNVAIHLSDKPNEASEWIPFIEGYAHSGDWQTAEDLTGRAFRQSEPDRLMLCHAWDRIDQTAGTGDSARRAVAGMLALLSCPKH